MSELKNARKGKLSNVPMLAISIVVLTLTCGAYGMAIHAGSKGDSRVLFQFMDITWYLSLFSMATSSLFFIFRRQKRFMLFAILGLILLLASEYFRSGGETTPLPYSVPRGNK